jgi:Tfp pilus assembly protein PilF
MAMARRDAWPVLVGLLALCGPFGCQTLPTPLEGMTSPVLVAAAASPAVESKHELPPDEAGRVCLATAEAEAKGGHYPEAVSLYEKACQGNPHLRPQVTRRLATLYGLQGNLAQAQEAYLQALQAAPKDADLLNDLGYTYYSRGDWAEAEKTLRQALSVNPQHQRAWINLGLSLGQQQRYEESLEAFSKAVGPGQAQCNLAFVYSTQGKRDEARVAYRKALDLDGSLTLAQAALEKLEKPAAPKPAHPAIPTHAAEKLAPPMPAPAPRPDLVAAKPVPEWPAPPAVPHSGLTGTSTTDDTWRPAEAGDATPRP